jgi:hypothetical protein
MALASKTVTRQSGTPGTRTPALTPSRLSLSPPRPIYRITSSARSSTDWGMVRPRALAVFRLITSSNLGGHSIGSRESLSRPSAPESHRRYFALRDGPEGEAEDGDRQSLHGAPPQCPRCYGGRQRAVNQGQLELHGLERKAAPFPRR